MADLRYRLAVLALIVGILAGCGAATTLPPPGASAGEIVLFRANAQPVKVQAGRIEQAGADPEALVCREVLMRVPLEQGHLIIASELAHYHAAGDELVRLVGPVSLRGRIRGDPVTGTAASAALMAPGDDMVLRALDLVIGDVRVRMDQFTIPESWSGDQFQGGGENFVGVAAPALVRAALIAGE